MMLTLTADGGAVRLTLSETEDLEECQGGAMLAVTSVLEGGVGIRYWPRNADPPT